MSEKTVEISTLRVGPNPGSQSVEIEIPENLDVLPDEGEISEHHSCFRILTQKDGDKRVVWDRRRLPEIRDAEKMFNNLVKEGLVPYRVGVDGKETSEVMDVFDPAAEEVIFLPTAMVAGG